MATSGVGNCCTSRTEIVINSKEIKFLYMLIWDIILPKLLFNTKSCPPPFHDLISIQNALGLFPYEQTQNNLEWILL